MSPRVHLKFTCKAAYIDQKVLWFSCFVQFLSLNILSPDVVYNFPPAGTVAEGAPIIPISAQLKYNIEVVCEYIVKKIPVPVRDFISEPRLIGKKNLMLCASAGSFHSVCSLFEICCLMKSLCT